jgi:sarcosine oxidase delta subunit
MTAVAEATRPWTYHSNRKNYMREYEHYGDMNKARAVIEYIKHHQGCRRVHILNDVTGFKSVNEVNNTITLIGNIDVQLYEDDDATLYYGGVK